MERMFKTENIIGKEYEFKNHKYLINQKLGSGGVGEVYAATNLVDENMICIKILNPRKEYEQQYHRMVERFYHEATIGQRLDHPNVVKIFEVSKINEYHCYSMEYCRHNNLKDLIRSNFSLDLNNKINIFFQICSGLEYIHNTGVHRDLKPDNILISNLEYTDIRIKISDFGTFFDITDISRNPETQANDRFGSLAYISPEQRQGEKVNCQTDIFALGLIFYQLLIEDTYEIRLNQQKFGAFLDYDSKFLLQNILGKMCENDVRFRYQSLNDVLLDFKPLINSGRWGFDKIKLPSWIKERKIAPNIEYSSSNLLNEINLNKIKFNKELWSFDVCNLMKENGEDTEEFFCTPTESVIKNQIVITGWSSGYATALSLNKGTLNWYQKISQQSITSTPIIFKDKCIFIDEFGKLICLNLYTGNLMWEDNLNKECTSPLKVWNEELIVTTNENKIILFNLTKRLVTKEIEIDSSYFQRQEDNRKVKANMLVQYQDSLFVCYRDLIKIYQNILNKERLNHIFLPIATNNDHFIYREDYFVGFTIDEKNIYATASNGAICCSDFDSGSLIWEIETAEFPSIPFIYNDFICFSTDAGFLYMCDKKSGATLKKVKIENYYKDDIKSIITIVTDHQILHFNESGVTIYDCHFFRKINSLYSWSTSYNSYPFCVNFKPPSFASNIMVLSGDDGVYAFDFNENNKFGHSPDR